jgi:transcriptional regulator with XRE-family HTH domain
VKSEESTADGEGVADDALALTLARAIRAERTRAGLTQAQLGERLGVHAVTVSQIENVTRRVYVDELPAICDALGVTLAQLLDRAPDARRSLGVGPTGT